MEELKELIKNSVKGKYIKTSEDGVESYETIMNENQDFLFIEGPFNRKQHSNQRCGLDYYVIVIRLETGERCCKKLYLNSKGLHFKHTGHSPQYLDEYIVPVKHVPEQIIIKGNGQK